MLDECFGYDVPIDQALDNFSVSANSDVISYKQTPLTNQG